MCPELQATCLIRPEGKPERSEGNQGRKNII